MFRKTLTILSLAGLLLSVGLWAASYWNLVRTSYKRDMRVTQGGLELRNRFPHTFYMAIRKNPDGSFETLPMNRWYFSGFGGWKTRWLPDFARSPRYLYVPLWIPGALFGLAFFGGHSLHHHRRRSRKKLGLCLKCGYDLRGSEERCPECGTEFDAAKNA